jgi:hypothetical protein
VRKKRPARVLFAAPLLIVLYFLLFPYPLGRELVVRPRWAVPVPTAAVIAPDPGAPSWQYQLGNRFGFLMNDGSALYAGTALYKVALSTSGFVNYTRLGTDWILQDTAGRRITSFSGSGYPLLGPDGTRIFNVKSDLSGIIELDRSGGTLWGRDFPAPMTSASIQGDFLLVGLMNGSLHLINRQGSPVFESSPGGSRIPVVLGTALSPDGTFIAAVCGIGPQKLVVFRRHNGGYAPLPVRELASDYRREVRMGFSPDSRYLFFESPDGAGLYDPAAQELRLAGVRGRLYGAGFPGHAKVAAFAAMDSGRAQVVIQPPSGAALYREDLTAHELSVGTIDGQLLLGWDGQFLRVDVEAM